MTNNIGYVCNFNNFSINSIPYVQVYLVDPFNPKRTLNIFALARRNARKVGSAYWQERKIYVGIYINAPTRALHDIAWDTLMQNIQGIEGTLVVEQSGTVRAYTCTFDDFSKNASGIGKGNAAPPLGGNADYTLQFECSDSYGYDTNYTLIRNNTGLTSGDIATQYTQGGGADTQVPYIQIQYTALSGATAKTVNIKNVVTGDILSITRTWSQYDIIQIDLRNKTVQVNGADTDFSGPLLEFGLGLQSIEVSDNFTSRTLNLLLYVYNRYN